MPFKIELSPGSVVGRTEPGPGIELWLRVGHTERPRAPTFAFHSCSPKVAIVVKNESFPVAARLTSVRSIEAGGDQFFPIDIFLETSFGLLESIEAARAHDGGVVIDVDLQLAVLPIKDGFALSPKAIEQQGGRFDLHRDAWLSVLRAVNFADVLVMEFPRRVVGEPQSPNVSAARGEIEKARRAFDDHDGDGVAHHAYLALDALSPGSGGVPDRLISRYFSGAHQEIQERMRKALTGLMPVYHVGRHAVGADAAPLVHVSRQHAAWIYGTVQLILGWCGAGAR